MNKKQYNTLLRIICSSVLFIIGVIIGFSFKSISVICLPLFIISALLVGFDVLLDAINGIIHGHMLDENFLMSIGSISAFILGEFAEGTIILLLYQVGELFQSIAVGKSRNSIAELMNICPDTARLESGEIVDPFEIVVGDIITVKPGEKIALDGIIISGESTLDTSSLTGEPLPKPVKVNDEVFSGTINLTSPLSIKVTKEFSESTVSKILELVENASTRKAKMESFVTRFAKYYTPIVVILAVIIATIPPLLFSFSFKTWLLRAVMFIVISCPCALVVSVPLSFFGALGAASKIGVLVKGSNYLEILGKIDTIVFDKTGTLTEGSFEINEIRTVEGVSENELLYVAALAEFHSSHPIAKAIKSSYNKDITPTSDMVFKDISGKGIVVKEKDRIILAGNKELISEYGFTTIEANDSATIVHICDNKYLGFILLEDKIKANAQNTIELIKKNGVKKVVMLSGDSDGSVSRVAGSLGFDKFYSELLPNDKVLITEKLIHESHKKVAFVGDGVNDAPVLARSDVGIAMGALGSDAAIEAADIVIMNDDISLISKTIKIAHKAVRICKQNIILSLIVKFSQLILSLIGLSNIWFAVFADVGVLIIAIINSMRTLNIKK